MRSIPSRLSVALTQARQVHQIYFDSLTNDERLDHMLDVTGDLTLDFYEVDLRSRGADPDKLAAHMIEIRARKAARN